MPKHKTRRRVLRKRGERGFTLIELLIVILIVSILASSAVPLYLSYVKDAKLAEGKALIGSVWTGIQVGAQLSCGTPYAMENVFPKAGLTSGGATQPPRWTVGPATGLTLLISCADSTYGLTGGPITVTGTVADNNTLIARLSYIFGNNPPASLTCSIDGGITFAPC